MVLPFKVLLKNYFLENKNPLDNNIPQGIFNYHLFLMETYLAGPTRFELAIFSVTS